MKYKQKLKEYREKKGYTQEDIAKILNISSQQLYSLYERDKRELPISKYIILAKLYNVKIDDLIEVIED